MQLANISVILATLFEKKLDKSKDSNEEQVVNIFIIVVADEVSKFDKSIYVKLIQFLKI